MESVIEVEHLRKAHGSTIAVSDVSFEVARGEIPRGLHIVQVPRHTVRKEEKGPHDSQASGAKTVAVWRFGCWAESRSRYLRAPVEVDGQHSILCQVFCQRRT